METPYTFQFSTPPLTVSERKPTHNTLRFPKAKETTHYTFGSSELSSQVLNFYPFYMDLIEINTTEDFTFSYEIQQPRHFLILMIKGSLRFTTQEGLFLSQVKDNHFGLSGSYEGVYRAEAKAGNHIALCVCIHTSWLHFIAPDLPALNAYLQQAPGVCTALPYCHLNKELRTILKEVRSKLSNGIAEFELFFKASFLTILKRYDSKAIKKQERLAYQALEFIHRHYTDSGLSTHSIASHFGKAERSLRDQFKTEFNSTINDYLIHLRVRYAIQLMQEKQVGPLDVFLDAGFREANALRYHLEKLKS